ncbi:hypothetical protein [Priestia aryabhattai]|uniref:hypothetical protein n=1 Tax=Priestia aryabhattai TaxID=412384 RepID=UPI001FB24CDC|nr:hypothetical protein [Priestia aryabhattai]
MSYKYVLKINNSDYALLDLTEHFVDRSEERLVDDPTIIRNAINLMISTDIITKSHEEYTYVVRDFKNKVSIVFKVDTYSKEEMEDNHSEVKNYKMAKLVVTFKTIYNSADLFQQYPYLMVFAIDDKGNLVTNSPMQHSDYDDWYLHYRKKPNNKTWKWPKKWSDEHLIMLKKNTDFNKDLEKTLEKYPRPKGYTF